MATSSASWRGAMASRRIRAIGWARAFRAAFSWVAGGARQRVSATSANEAREVRAVARKPF
eukprot:14247154-Alexandrium_andersonii.AAC.1